jgi:hypothetical protein
MGSQKLKVLGAEEVCVNWLTLVKKVGKKERIILYKLENNKVMYTYWYKIAYYIVELLKMLPSIVIHHIVVLG